MKVNNMLYFISESYGRVVEGSGKSFAVYADKAALIEEYLFINSDNIYGYEKW